ncbi:MAG: DNA polymerase III subunit delta [Lachnospiraceae bacterium]|nr:DNA polymerase III subunit delta [Lachnospiraceae bacterium]
MNDVKEKSFRRVYLITGDDPWLRHGFLSRLLHAAAGTDTLNRMDVSGSDLSLPEMRAFTDTMPFFSDRRVLVVEESGLFRVRQKKGDTSETDDASGEKESSESEEENAAKGESADAYQNWIKTLPETALVIFVETKADGRSALYKLISRIGSITVVERPKKAEELRRFAMSLIGKSGLKITQGAFALLMERLPLDYGMSETEIEKLISRCLEKGSIQAEDVEEMLTPRLEDKVFDLVERVSSKDRKGALRCYYDLVALRTSSLLVLTLIGKEFIRLLNVKEMAEKGLPDREIMSVMSFSKEWLSEKYRRAAHRFRKGQLLRAASYEAELELAVKSGNLNENSAVEMLILSMTEEPKEPGR